MTVCEKHDDGSDVCQNADYPSDLDEIVLLEIEPVAISGDLSNTVNYAYVSLL